MDTGVKVNYSETVSSMKTVKVQKLSKEAKGKIIQRIVGAACFLLCLLWLSVIPEDNGGAVVLFLLGLLLLLYPKWILGNPNYGKTK